MARFLNRKIFLIALSLLIALVIINIIPGLTKALGNFIFKIFSPIGRFFISIGNKISGFFNILISIGGLNKENILLRQQNQALEAELTNLKTIERENEILKSALNINKNTPGVKQVALIVGKDIQGLQDWILINKGTKDGVETNMIVVSPENALVGRISEAQADFSKVMLIINKESVIAAIIENSRTEGLIKRSEQGGIFMDFIPNTENIQPSERIITSGMDNVYPKGILIGKIETIDSSENQLFKKITIIPEVNFNKLEEVIILK